MSPEKLTFNSENISVYIHWPYCLNKCPYCDFNSYVPVDSINYDLWERAYINEIDRQSQYLKNKFIKTIFFGGGTPSLIKPELIKTIIITLSKFNNNKPISEITLECNPSSIETSKLKAFKEAGINRISVGVQSFNENNLKFLGRNHSVKEAVKSLEIANTIFNNVTFDLINGLPYQSLKDWILELKYALPLITSHISIYELTIEPNTQFFKLNIPKVKSKVATELFNYTIDTLTNVSIPPYEISNYARLGNECLHNLQYWLGGLYLGIGPGAHGRIIVNDKIYATLSHKNPKKWLELAINNKSVFNEYYVLSKNQRLMELLILNLRLYKDISPMIIKFINIEAINFLCEQNFMIKKNTSYYLTRKGRMQLNGIINYLSTQVKI